MKNSVKRVGKTLLVSALACSTLLTQAQEENRFDVGADLVSSYVWRGIQQDGTYSAGSPNIQPYASFSYGNFTVGAWGSGSFTGTVREFDLYASYSFLDNLSLTVTDYNWNFSKSYFDYSKSTDHVYEASVAYGGIEALPLSATVSTMFYGADKEEYSTYLELAYPLSSAVSLSAGASLFESSLYGTSGFGVTNVALRVEKSIAFSEQFQLPMFGIVGFNPAAENAYLVVGVSF